MTRRLSKLAGSVAATDVSQEMLKRARANLADDHMLGMGEVLADLRRDMRRR